MIQVEKLSKTFRVHKKEAGLKASFTSLFSRQVVEKRALDAVSLSIEGGEILGLVGANGAGKTTLVKALAGIIHPSSGTARVLGHVPWERHFEFRKSIALIMGQKAQLWWDLPAADCFLLLKEIYQIPKNRFHESLDYLVDSLQVKDQLNVPIRRLSLGERMKMELISALLHDPKVVYLDEPTIGLDITAQKSIRRFLLKYRKEQQPAMILTSHYMEDIESLCERIVIIRNGSFIFDGSLSRIHMDFSRHKVLAAKLGSIVGSESSAPVQFPVDLGEVLSVDESMIKIKVPKEKISQAASYLLSKFPVSDLSIEETEIGVLIEEIMKKGLI